LIFNRLWKKVTPKGSGAVTSTYYYLRDAQGNEMCRYVKYTNTTSQLMYVAQEHSIYGSSRVGVDNRKDTLYMGAVYTPTWGGVGTSRRALGLKSFELANHLGNILVTISDKPIYNVSSGTIYFQPEITSISDYYPFGAPIQGRSYSSSEYRFGFNTQEKTDEISGTGNHFTAQFWEYDTRLGRRWNQDPKPNPSISNYAAFANNPIWYKDPLGDTIIVNSNTKNKDGSAYTMFKLDDGKKDLLNQSYDQFKKTGVQWYAEKEKNYAKMTYLNPNLVKDGKAKGVSAKQFATTINSIRTVLHKSTSYSLFGWWTPSIYNNFNHGEQGDIKAKGKLLDGFQLTVYTGSDGKQQLIRSDLLGNFVFGYMAKEHGQTFQTSRGQGDFLQAEGVDDRLDTYFLLLGHQQRQAGNTVPNSFKKDATIPE
jgi:RHS repeat-associated protein